VAVLGMTRSSRAADRSLRLASTEDTGHADMCCSWIGDVLWYVPESLWCN